MLLSDITENQTLTERVSSTLYHYTNVHAGAKIMQQGQFELTSVLGTDWESRFAPPGYPYYLSATRTRTGGYHDYVGSSAVMFVLAGDWFNARYPGQAVDYWGNRAPSQGHHRAHEAEDRIFSKQPTIPVGGVQAVHVLVKPDAEPNRRTWARQLILAAKKRGIPAYLYSDEQAWRRFDTSRTAHVSTLRGEITYGRSPSRHRGYLMPWMELMFGQDQARLSKRADQLRYNLNYHYNAQDAVRSLGTDLSNARKPDSGPDREHAVKIIDLMRRNGLKTLSDLVDWIRARWAAKASVKENDQEHTQALQQTGFWGRQGAGCIFMALDTGRLCLAHRSAAVEQPGTWGTWGGAMESGEDPAEAVRREVAEEAGYTGPLRLIPLMVFSHPSGFRYHNFLALVPREFEPRLNWETQDSAWFKPGEWPSPLHPGVVSVAADSHSNDIIDLIGDRIQQVSEDLDQGARKIQRAAIDFYQNRVPDAAEGPVENYRAQARELLGQAPGQLRDRVLKVLRQGGKNPYIQGGVITAVGAILAGAALTSAQRMGLTPTQTNMLLQALLNTVIPTMVSRVNGRNWRDTVKYTLASMGVGTGIAAITERDIEENFADGRKPGRKGLSRRVGIPKKATLAQLEKIARSSTGERRRMAQWQLNMRRGQARKNK